MPAARGWCWAAHLGLEFMAACWSPKTELKQPVRPFPYDLPAAAKKAKIDSCRPLFAALDLVWRVWGPAIFILPVAVRRAAPGSVPWPAPPGRGESMKHLDRCHSFLPSVLATALPRGLAVLAVLAAAAVPAALALPP